VKTLPLLALLTLTLAACSQASTPTAVGTGDVVAVTHPSGIYANTQAANDAFVLADLNRLGTLAIAPLAYLNVLPVPGSTDSVRAYVKTSFASPVTTSVSWGDGTATTAVATPTVSRIETHDHAYAVFGTYTVTLTSRDGAGVVIDTRTFTVQAGKVPVASDTVITFDAPPVAANSRADYAVYSEAGFSFQRPNYTVSRFGVPFNGFNVGSSTGLYMFFSSATDFMTPDDGKPFALKSLDVRDIVVDSISNVRITGHKTDGSTVTLTTNEVANAAVTVTFDGSWQNLLSVDFQSAGGRNESYFDNVTVRR